MKIAYWLKRIAISSLLIIFVCITGGPWFLYYWGLSGIDGKPNEPRYSATEIERQVIWKQVHGNGIPEVVSITPYEYFFLDSSKPNNSNKKASVLLAWKVASKFNISHLKYNGMLWWHFSGASLTIWLTRNWTTDQLMSKIAEDQRQ